MDQALLRTNQILAIFESKFDNSCGLFDSSEILLKGHIENCFMSTAVDQGQSQRLVNERSLVRFPWSTCRSVLGQDTEPQTAPEVLVGTLRGSHHHQCMNVYMKLLWTEVSDKCPLMQMMF